MFDGHRSYFYSPMHREESGRSFQQNSSESINLISFSRRQQLTQFNAIAGMKKRKTYINRSYISSRLTLTASFESLIYD